MTAAHLGAFACFAVSIACYVVAWTPGLWVSAVVGVVFEIAAWLALWKRRDEP